MFQIVRGGQSPEHVDQIAGDGDLLDRRPERALIDDEAGRAAAIVAGDGVDPLTDQARDIEAGADIGDQFRRTEASRLEMDIGRAGLVWHPNGQTLSFSAEPGWRDELKYNKSDIWLVILSLVIW